MDFVTITDHDTIDGVLAIADRPDVFISEELTASFRGEPQAVHVLCYGITPDDHEWLQAHRGDVELCAAYMHEREIACALAHPYYTVAAPLTGRHRRRLAELFAVWEVRNGARAPELNRPAAIYVATRDGIGIGGSDDHAGVDIGRTSRETPRGAHPGGVPRARARRARQRPAASRAAPRSGPTPRSRWRSARSGRDGGRGGGRPDPRRVLRMAARLLREGDAREGAAGGELSPDDARCLLRGLAARGRPRPPRRRELIAHMQDERFSHADLYRRACRAHERGCARPSQRRSAAAQRRVGRRAGRGRPVRRPASPRSPTRPRRRSSPASRPSCARSPPQGRPGRREDGETPRVAIVADGIGATHGVTARSRRSASAACRASRSRSSGTDPSVDRRLAAVAEVEVPYYPGLRIGVPSLPGGRPGARRRPLRRDPRLLAGPGGRRRRARRARAGAAAARQLPHRARPPTPACAPASRRVAEAMARGRRRLLRRMRARALAERRRRRGAGRRSASPRERVAALGPRRRHGPLRPGAARRGRCCREASTSSTPGRITREKGVDLLADAFLEARAAATRACTSCSPAAAPSRSASRERLGAHATFLGWLEGDELARAYASADIFLFPSATDTFGQVVLEAQASGLPVVAVAERRPAVADRARRRRAAAARPTPAALAEALLELAALAAAARAPRRGGAARGARADLGARARAARRRLPPSAERRPGSRRLRAPRPSSRLGRNVHASLHPQAHHANDRRRAPRHRAGDVRALRADPRLARRPRRRPRDAAGDPRPRPASGRRALPGDDELARASAAPRATRSPSTASSTSATGAGRSTGDDRPRPGASPRRVPRARRRRDQARRQRRLARAEARRHRAGRLRRARLRLHAPRCARRCGSASAGGPGLLRVHRTDAGTRTSAWTLRWRRP